MMPPCCRERRRTYNSNCYFWSAGGNFINYPVLGVLYNFPFLPLLLFQSSQFSFTVHVEMLLAGIVFLILCVLAFHKKNCSSGQNRKSSLINHPGRYGLASAVVIFYSVQIFSMQNYHSCSLSNKTIEVLNKLNEVSKPDDFVITWWDYGSSCLF